MAKRNWKDHPLVGKTVSLKDGNDAKVMDVKRGPMYADMNSMVGDIKMIATLRLRLKISGRQEFWSAPVVYEQIAEVARG